MRCSCGILTPWLHTAAGGSRHRATDMKWGNDAPINSYWMDPLKRLQSCQATGNCRDSYLISNEHFIMVCIQTMLSIYFKSTWKYSLPKSVNSIIIYSPLTLFQTCMTLFSVKPQKYIYFEKCQYKIFFQRLFFLNNFILCELSLWGTNSCFHKVYHFNCHS